jgi:phosphoribosylaminoimidazole-succinocarboxamide synthase
MMINVLGLFRALWWIGCGAIDMKGVPDKGKILTQISLFWFNKLKHIIPTHFVTADIEEMPEEIRRYKEQLEGRTMLVKRAKVIPLEAIVRGYLTGRSSELCSIAVLLIS